MTNATGLLSGSAWICPGGYILWMRFQYRAAYRRAPRRGVALVPVMGQTQATYGHYLGSNTYGAPQLLWHRTLNRGNGQMNSQHQSLFNGANHPLDAAYRNRDKDAIQDLGKRRFIQRSPQHREVLADTTAQ